MVQKDLDPCARLLLRQHAHKDPMDAAGACGIQEDVAAGAIRCRRHHLLEVRAVCIAAAAIPGARHGRVGCLQFRQMVHGAQAAKEEAQITHGLLILSDSGQN